MTVFFTSDTHFSHKNILKYCSRSYPTIEDMDAGLVELWNQTVSPTDTVYHLGDFGGKAALPILPRLNGSKHLITGNHDPEIIRSAPEWISSQAYLEIKIECYRIILFHYPILEWNASHYGSLHFHGHLHGSMANRPQTCDVGVDCWAMKPVSFPDILEYLQIQGKSSNACAGME